jgi:protein-S-isoprenylcysteine O-methyltransferase Ste14
MVGDSFQTMEKKRKIIPPVYLFFALAFMWLLQRYFPVVQLVETPLAYAGVIPVLLGIMMAAISAGMFVKADTGLEPFEEATTLVTGGFYRVTRNPMYMGMFLILFGVAILLGSVSALLPLVIFVLIIRYNFVLGEERFLEKAFGQQYLDYKSEVRRWL